jgi:solute carrier family 10 (sodium/bile acid cotransporter), member 7
LMLFHQMQLMVCASLARHYAARRITVSKLLPGLPATSA